MNTSGRLDRQIILSDRSFISFIIEVVLKAFCRKDDLDSTALQTQTGSVVKKTTDTGNDRSKSSLERVVKRISTLFRRKSPSTNKKTGQSGISIRRGRSDQGTGFDLRLIDDVVCPEKPYHLLTLENVKRRAFIAYNTRHRYGADFEAEYLQKQLEALNFEVENYIDFKAEELLEELKKFCEENAKTTSILIVVVMAHGSWGRVHDKDDRFIDINEILEPMTLIQDNVPKVLIVQACQGGLHKKSSDYDGSTPTTAIKARSTDVHLQETDMAVIMSTLWGQISARQFFIPIFSDILKETVSEPMEISEIFRRTCAIMTGPEREQYVSTPLRDQSANRHKPLRYAPGEPSRRAVMQIPCFHSTLRKPLIIGLEL